MQPTATPNRCAECDSALPPDAPDDLCWRCSPPDDYDHAEALEREAERWEGRRDYDDGGQSGRGWRR